MSPRPVRVRVLPAPSSTDLTSAITDEPLLSAAAAAQRLAYSVDTVKRMARMGELPSIKFRKSVRFEQAAIRAYIAKHRRVG